MSAELDAEKASDAELQELYHDVLVDYYKDTARQGRLDPHDVRAHGVNPVCGDEVELTLRLKDGKVDAVRYGGQGCVISRASTAMMTEALEGGTLADARAMALAFKAFMTAGAPPESLPEKLSESAALAGVRKFPLRVKCAMLGWNTLLRGLDDLSKGGHDAEYQDTPICQTGAQRKDMVTFKQIGDAVGPIKDPEIHVSVAELGLIYGAEIKPSDAGPGTRVKLIMSLTSPACPYGPMLLASVHGALAKIPGVRDVDVDLSFVPTWDPRTMASEEAKDQLGIF
ncbi:MAG: SUF system NifU family Fe-S cluster assembly protein [Elusimicrobia bacterium]|nr:SUF system NifU family Fe-S cluster assembly protein [Elusimicrobiota bacterium]